MKGEVYLVGVLTLCACAPFLGPQIDWNNPQAIASNIATKRDDFKKLTEFKGPNCSGNTFDSVFIRAWKLDVLQHVKYQIYVMDHYGDEWRFYHSAWDSNGKKLDANVISRKVGSCSGSGGCSHYEHLGIDVTREYLENNKETGIRFKISGKAGEEVFSIPPAYITAFLDATR